MAGKRRPKKIGVRPGDPGFIIPPDLAQRAKNANFNIEPKIRPPASKAGKSKRKKGPPSRTSPNVRITPKRKK